MILKELQNSAADKQLSTYPRPRPVACAHASLTLPVVVVVGMWVTERLIRAPDGRGK